MPTKLSRYAEAVMEAAWLASLIFAPVFFDIYSSRIFEPDKVSLIRSLALLILAAWGIKFLEEGNKNVKKGSPGTPWWKTIWQIPFIAPVLALAISYLVATILSVTPRVSLWGSYQRLQGTYTTFSYLIIFASIVANLRCRDQISRLITVAILVSLPVSIYGILQRLNLDPIPWGGDVSTRIAANMGNSIFAAAYFILVFPLTLVRIVESFEALYKGKGRTLTEFIRATVYIFIAALQLLALYLTGSRGPWLGWAVGMVFLWLGFSLIWRARWLTISGVALAVAAASFLLVLNIPNGPLESLRKLPQFGRLGQLLDAESRTGRVRTLIWQGAAELYLPHPPLEYPDGHSDALNVIRPLIGYGPESMYVAYNPFYPPELTQVEKRNASPDRSHNETWDALVTTGLIGLVVYLSLFGSVLYYGMKWLGIIQSERQRSLYLALYIAGGLISAVLFVVWKGIGFLGVALPFGMIVGVILFLIWTSLFSPMLSLRTPAERSRAYLILGFLAAILAHFVEINFGIAIVSTRTYFWIYAALLLIAGHYLPEWEVNAIPGVARNSQGNAYSRPDPTQARNRGPKSIRKKRRSARNETPIYTSNLPEWARRSLLIGLLGAFLLATLGFLYITNASHNPHILSTIWYSLTRSKQTPESSASYGILSLVITTALLGGVVLASEESGQNADGLEDGTVKFWRVFIVGVLISVFLTLFYWFWHAGGLTALSRSTATTIDEVLDQVDQSLKILTRYYLFMLVCLLALAFALVDSWPEKAFRSGLLSFVMASSALVAALVLAAITNLRVVQADIAFKTADLFAHPNTWPVAIRIYERANQLSPNEDYYYLFLGRAYLEYARSIEDSQSRASLISRAASDLKKAQGINPLNPDHTANLARLNSMWAQMTSDPVARSELAKTSDQYFSQALVLKPNDAKLWDEWALLYLNVNQQPQEALDRFDRALEIDPFYDWTYGLLGDYTLHYVSDQLVKDSAEWQRSMQEAEKYFSKALEYGVPGGSSLNYNYAVSLAGIQINLNQISDGIRTYELALTLLPSNPDNWKIEETLANLYAQSGDSAQALSHALTALQNAPEDQKPRLQELVTSFGG